MERVAAGPQASLRGPLMGRRPVGKAGRAIVCRAAGSRYQNPIGVHQNVWVGGWSKEEVEATVSGSKEAGYDLVECGWLKILTAVVATWVCHWA